MRSRGFPAFFSMICGATDAILGGRSGASKRLKKRAEESGALLPVFVAPGQLKPFISNELMNGPFSPIGYISGGKVATGFDAVFTSAVTCCSQVIDSTL